MTRTAFRGNKRETEGDSMKSSMPDKTTLRIGNRSIPVLDDSASEILKR